MGKPRIISPCVAERSTRDPLQRIAEFSTDHGGGLISIRDMGDHARVEVYRCDDGVKVTSPADPLRDAAPDMLAALKEAQQWLSGIVDSDDILPDDRECLERIGAAIARAEGRAP